MTTLRELEWFEPPTPCEDSDIANLEAHLGVVFPKDYRLFVATSGGGSPVETDFDINEPRGVFNASIGVFLTVADGKYGIAETLRNIEERKIDGLIPVAESGGGDFVCLDYRESDSPVIAYWHHGRHGLDDELVIVCDTFSEFLSLLEEPADE